jgi:hypothetical protein
MPPIMEAIEWLPSRTNQLIEQAVRSLQQALGDGLDAALLVGTAMNPSRADRARAPEVLAMIGSGVQLDVHALARALHGPMTAGARVRIVTRRELERSCDVFALEIADWKARHRVLLGEDPLSELAVKPAHLRHALETELRGLSRRIRNRLLTGLATDAQRDDPKNAVIAGFDGFVVAAYHALALLGEEPPSDEPAIVRAFVKHLGLGATRFLGHLEILRKGEQKLDLVEAFGALSELIEPAIELVDAHEVER